MEPLKAIVQYKLPLEENSRRNLYSMEYGRGGPLGRTGLARGAGLSMAELVGGATEVNRQ